MFRNFSPLGPTPLARLLGAVYFFAVNIRNRYWDTHPNAMYRSPCPVISVGGINAGGTGKTPVAMMITAAIAQQGKHAALISRGYRRKSNKTIVSPPGREARWEDTGDEPAMIRRRIPACWLGIGGDRRKSMRRIAQQTGNNAVFILDDGFQHRRVARDMNIAVIPVNALNDLPIPGGTLREPSSNLSRATAILVTGSAENEGDIQKTCEQIRLKHPGCLVAGIVQEPDTWVNFNTGRTAQSAPLVNPVALCGIARPERFFAALESTGVKPVKCAVYPDHHTYCDTDIEPIGDAACRNGLVTTEKDAVKLLNLKLVNQFDMWYLKIKVRFIDQSSEKDFFDQIHSLATGNGGK